MSLMHEAARVRRLNILRFRLPNYDLIWQLIFRLNIQIVNLITNFLNQTASSIKGRFIVWQLKIPILNWNLLFIVYLVAVSLVVVVNLTFMFRLRSITDFAIALRLIWRIDGIFNQVGIRG